MPLPRFAASAVFAILFLLPGCKDRQITAYRAPKDPASAELPAAGVANTNDLPPGHPPVNAGASDGVGPSAMANTAVPTANGNDLTWTAPAGWIAKPGSAMRKGSYAVKGDGGGADLSITAFPGATGGLEANLNRWRGQVGLPPQSAGDVAAAVEKFSANGLDFVVVDYAGKAGGSAVRLIGAIVPFNGNSWFFKLMGPDALVAQAKPAFLEFLQTVRGP